MRLSDSMESIRKYKLLTTIDASFIVVIGLTEDLYIVQYNFALSGQVRWREHPKPHRTPLHRPLI